VARARSGAVFCNSYRMAAAWPSQRRRSPLGAGTLFAAITDRVGYSWSYSWYAQQDVWAFFGSFTWGPRSCAARSYSEELGKWMEVGNSGIFRPEMLRPMGLPEDVTVIAWGLSLERCTCSSNDSDSALMRTPASALRPPPLGGPSAAIRPFAAVLSWSP
jgi:tRNA synthetases class II core domain (F)